MRLARVWSAIAAILRLFSFALLLPIPVALLYDPWDHPVLGYDIPRNVLVFLAAFAIAVLVWAPLHHLTRKASEDDLLDREAYLVVSLGWLAVTLVGMTPFLISGDLQSPVDAFFETMSGLTTTGFTVVADADGTDPSILFWRSTLQWVGGLGIIVLMVALLSKLTHGGLQLFQAEASGHAQRIRPKLAETARTLWILYSTVTLVFIVILLLIFYYHTGLGLKTAIFEAVNHVAAALATGGFATHGASVRYFDDPVLEGALTFMMLAGATNFALVYGLVRYGRWRPLFKSPEWRFFIAIYGLACLAVTAALLSNGAGLGRALRHSTFNVASIYTTTGFASTDFALWPDPALVILLLLTLMGGMAGSTTGAIKSIRWLILTKAVARELRKLLHPRAVLPVRVGHRMIPEDILATVISFFFTYLAIWTLATLILVSTEPLVGIFDGIVLASSSLGNVGAGVGVAGPFASPGVPALLPSTKILMAFLMWFGRLEIFTALLLFYPSSWRR
jgi:trk system potassium uptake protein TrkH